MIHDNPESMCHAHYRCTASCTAKNKPNILLPRLPNYSVFVAAPKDGCVYICFVVYTAAIHPAKQACRYYRGE